MKASESVKNYASSVRMYTNYTVREIKKICKEIGPRPAGSESEKKAQEYIADQMRTAADEVTIEEFKLSPKAFMSFISICGTFLIVAVIFSLLKLPVVSAILTAVAFVCLLLEFVMYKEFYDFIFPKAISHNVIGVKKATGEAKKRIIFSGHVDSSYEWTYTHLGGKGLLFPCGIYAVISLIAVCVINVLFTFDVIVPEDAAYNVLYWAQLGLMPAGIVAICFVNFRRCVHGANDNLTGTLSSVAILKFLKDNDINFEETEVVAMSAGSEESGLRGSRAYIKRHLDELKKIPTIFVGLETLRDYEDIAIYQRDMSGTVKMDAGVCSLLKKAGKEAGYDLPYSSVYLGASDGAAVQQLGIPAVTLAAMNPGPPRYYHTRRDTADNMNMKTVEKGLEIALNALFIYDEEGYKKNYE
ncbi:MAG: M28 family peptidase [Clostridia bacterium]|nr:M28 family peptidase [Clostridia bacterium]